MMHFFQRISFRGALFLLLLVTGLLPLLGVASLNLPRVLKKFSDLRRSEIIYQMDKKAHDFGLMLRRFEEDMRLVAQLPGARSLFSKPSLRHAPPEITRKQLPLFLNTWLRYQKLESLILIDVNGTIGFSWINPDIAVGKEMLISPEQIEQQRLWLKRARQRMPGKVFIGTVEQGREVGPGEHAHDPKIVLVAPLFDNNDRFSGIAVGRFCLLERGRQDIPFDLLVNGRGTILYTADEFWHGQGDGGLGNDHGIGTDLPCSRELPLVDGGERYLFLTCARGKKMLFRQVLPDTEHEHSLWVAELVDSTELARWIHGFILRIIICISAFISVAFLVAVLVSRKTDKERTVLLDAVTGLVHQKQPVHLNWKWPRELVDLAKELRSLSMIFLDHQRELQAKNRFFRGVFDGIQDGVAVISKEFLVIDTNKTLKEWRRDMMPLTGKPCHFVFRLRSVPCENCPTKLAVTTGTLQREEFSVPTSDGDELWYEVSAYPIFDETGEVSSVVEFFRDITERKKADRERAGLEHQLAFAQKMESIGTLAGGVAHDFNNMLSAINGYAELSLMKMSKDDPHYHAMETILKSGRRAARLTSQLLAFSRKQVFNLEPVDVNHEIDDLRKMVARLLGEHIEVVIRPGENLWTVRADRIQLGQVLINMAVNARDAMEGGGTLTIETANITLGTMNNPALPDLPSGDYVQITVSDTGHGMSREMMVHIFEPFFTTKEKGKGTGLGLATSYGIIRQHGGSIHVYSEPGYGTVFTIYLPRIRRNVRVGKREEPPAPVLEKKDAATILLVEDEPMVRTICRDILEERGHRVIEAENGEDGLDMYGRFRDEIDLLLTDVIMPKMGGVDLAAAIHEITPGLPVIFMSGYTGDRILDQGRFKEGVNFIHKPLTTDVLISTVTAVLKRSGKSAQEKATGGEEAE